MMAALEEAYPITVKTMRCDRALINPIYTTALTSDSYVLMALAESCLHPDSTGSTSVESRRLFSIFLGMACHIFGPPQTFLRICTWSSTIPANVKKPNWLQRSLGSLLWRRGQLRYSHPDVSVSFLYAGLVHIVGCEAAALEVGVLLRDRSQAADVGQLQGHSARVSSTRLSSRRTDFEGFADSNPVGGLINGKSRPRSQSSDYTAW